MDSQRKSNAWLKHREDLFDTWTEESAYLLGYLEADGYVNYKNQGSKAATITFCSSIDDKGYIEKLKELTQHTGKTFLRNHHIKGKVYQTTGFVISSRNWKIFLQENLRINKIPEIPEKYLHHYIRGYFDGDGSVYYDKGRTFVSFVFATEELANSFLDKISKVIGSSSGMKVYKKSKAECWYFRIAKQSLVSSFSNWIYKDAMIFLNRKEEKLRKITSKAG